ncbi:MAG: hypothetical protein SPK36_05540 [Bacilli bacterium]|nr:hypothetical protein [Bacilli bacterium]
MLVNVNKKLMLDDYEINVLKKYNIDISNCNNLREVTLLVEHFMDNYELDSEELDELDYILEKLQERNYYQNTNK